VRQFKLSTDPQFTAKPRDIVGLYVDPPAHAIVLSVDEKSQIPALDRTQPGLPIKTRLADQDQACRSRPGLPIKKGRAGTMTHDYKRNGTTTLFAALDVLEGKVIGRCMQRHRHQEFIRFLNAIEAEVPAGRIVHVILDNYGPHKHPKTRAWLDRHPRFVFHFTPTSGSWLNAVEGFFAKLSKRRLKRGVFRSIVDLQAAINRFLRETNDHPKPFCWTANPDKIIAAVRSGHQTLDSLLSHVRHYQMQARSEEMAGRSRGGRLRPANTPNLRLGEDARGLPRTYRQTSGEDRVGIYLSGANQGRGRVGCESVACRLTIGGRCGRGLLIPKLWARRRRCWTCQTLTRPERRKTARAGRSNRRLDRYGHQTRRVAHVT
jgi:transposase